MADRDRCGVRDPARSHQHWLHPRSSFATAALWRGRVPRRRPGRSVVRCECPFATMAAARGDIFIRIAGIANQIGASRAPALNVGAHGINQSRCLTQIDAEPGGVKTSAQNGIAKRQGVIVRICAPDGKRLRQSYDVLDSRAVSRTAKVADLLSGTMGRFTEG